MTRPRRQLATTIAAVASSALVLTATSAVAASPPAAATTVRWASPTGSGTECTQTAPCDLDTAVEHPTVTDGDDVVVLPGDYDVSRLEVSDAITLHGEVGQPRPTITTSDVFAVYVTDAATLRDLDFVHTVNSFGLAAAAAGVVVERVTSRSTAASGNACTPAASSTWRDSVCWATGENTRGMGTNSQPRPGTYSLTLRNLTLVGESSGLGLDFGGAGVNVVVDARNVVASSPGDDVRADGSQGATVQITMTGSNYADELELANTGSTASVTDPGTGSNQTAEPIFVDAPHGDFHQAAGSPTIDAGVVDGSLGALDLDGDPRVARGTSAPCPAVPDIGADERVTSLECDPPETSIDSGPSATTTDSAPSFGLSADEPATTFECRVDLGEFEPCPTPYTTAVLTLGAHTVEARATDASGNLDESPATRSFTVVAPPAAEPDTRLTKTPRKRVRTSRKRAQVTFGFTSTRSGGFECSLDKAPFTPCASPLTFKVATGRHTMRVRAVSGSGVVDPTPASYTFRVRRRTSEGG